jgi:hypothetical protein
MGIGRRFATLFYLSAISGVNSRSPDHPETIMKFN